MKQEVIRPKIQQETDQQVPEFGGYQPSELCHPLERETQQDVFNGAQRALRKSAVERSDLDSVECVPKSALNKERLEAFVKGHHLAIAWERDLALTLQELKPEDWEYLQRVKGYVEVFAHSKIPALLVDETNFVTIAVAQSDHVKIVPLQPMHQALYNQRERPMAIPFKQQSNGRSEGNDIRIEVQHL